MRLFPKACDGSKSKILIVLIAGIGDLILASKAIRAVRNSNPESEIYLLTSTEAAPIAANYPYIDTVHSFPIRELRKKKRYLLDILGIVRDLRKKDFALVLNMFRVTSFTGAMKMGLLFSLLKARSKIGHDRYGFGWFLTQKVPAGTFEGSHIVDAMHEIALRAGGVADGHGIEVFWDPGIVSKWDASFAAHAGKILVGINPGGDRENRRWAPERFASVAQKITEQFDAQIVLLGGPSEKNIARSIANSIPAEVSNLSGELFIDELPYVISRLDLLITNDSGPMHIAAATRTPLVAMFGPGDPTLFSPYTKPQFYRAIHKDIPCRPCEKEKCTRPTCLDLITTEEVLAACCELLHR